MIPGYNPPPTMPAADVTVQQPASQTTAGPAVVANLVVAPLPRGEVSTMVYTGTFRIDKWQPSDDDIARVMADRAITPADDERLARQMVDNWLHDPDDVVIVTRP